MGRLDPKAFAAWVRESLPQLTDKPMALDGKALKISCGGQSIMHPIGAFARRAHWVLAQEAAGNKPNKITAIPALLDLLDLSAALVTIDVLE